MSGRRVLWGAETDALQIAPDAIADEEAKAIKDAQYEVRWEGSWRTPFLLRTFRASEQYLGRFNFFKGVSVLSRHFHY